MAAAMATALLLTLGGAVPAQALGYKEVNCSGGGKLYAGSWNYGGSDAGAWSRRDPGTCGGQVAVQVNYQVYPGGPSATTGTSAGATFIQRNQTGAWGGIHRANGASGNLASTTT